MRRRSSRLLAECGADWIVNAAAYTAVDLAEDAAGDEAAAVNDTGRRSAGAGRCPVQPARLLHLSTDFVFDGASNRAYTPGDAPRPLSVYGATKLGGERRALECRAARHRRSHRLGVCRRGAQFRAHHAAADARAGTSAAWSAIKSARRPGPRASPMPSGDLIGVRARPGIYHWTDLGVGELVRFCGRHSGRGARARAVDARRRPSCPSRPRSIRPAPGGPRSACSIRGDACAAPDAGGALAPQLEDDAG